MKVLVCGGRHYAAAKKLYDALDQLHKRTPITTLIHGGADGADSIAGAWAAVRGVKTDIHPANWALHGKAAAGRIRNQEMLNESPAIVVAFMGGKGTADMVSRARDKGTPVWQPDYEPKYMG